MLNKLFFIFSIFFSVLHAKEGTFLLLLGPSGAGKSTLIQHLKEIDPRFVYISPYTTRELRVGETDKVHVSFEAMKELEEEGNLLTVNAIYGIYYATPKNSIDQALEKGDIPILDWPIDKLDTMKKNYSSNLLTVYVEPESLESLQKHLSLDGRDKEGQRFSAGKNELEKYYQGEYDSLINYKVINIDGQAENVAAFIYRMIKIHQ